MEKACIGHKAFSALVGGGNVQCRRDWQNWLMRLVKE